MYKRQRYTVTRGQIIFRGQDITHETADVRARAGMFLSFQTPEEIPGITLAVSYTHLQRKPVRKSSASSAAEAIVKNIWSTSV